MGSEMGIRDSGTFNRSRGCSADLKSGLQSLAIFPHSLNGAARAIVFGEGSSSPLLQLGRGARSKLAFEARYPALCRVEFPDPCEQRGAAEVRRINGGDEQGRGVEVRLLPEGAAARNPAFDVTPARLIQGFITERGCFTPGQLGRLTPSM